MTRGVSDAGIARCWDLWVGCLVGVACSAYIKHILMLPYF